MLFVGVDISTSKFDVAVMNQQFKILASKSFSFDSEGFSQFVSFLKKFDEPVSIAMEASGSFTLNLFDFLNEHNFNVFILHPFLSMQGKLLMFAQGFSISFRIGLI